MSVDIHKLSPFLAGGIETVRGQMPATMVLFRTRDLSPDIYEGDQKQRTYDGDSGRFTPTVTGNPHNKFSFKTDYAGSGDVTKLPAIDHLLRMAGLSRAANPEAGFDYLISDAGDVDSGTLLMREKVEGHTSGGNARYYIYETNAVNGHVGIDLKVDEDPLFNFELMGNYKRPVDSQIPEVELVYVDQAQPEIFGDASVVKAQLGDPSDNNVFHDVCLHSFTIPNYSGFTAQRSNAVNCAGTSLKAIPIEGSMTIKMPDWTEEFHIYELGESHQGYVTVPFSLHQGTSAGNKVNIDISALQIKKPTRTTLDDDMLGIQLDFTCMAKPVLTIA